jgi:type IV pilus assembly protein PilQ
MRARPATLSIVALVCAAIAGSVSARATAPVARLLDIRPHHENGRTAVLIEASAPVAYAASQPDPLTVLVDLRDVNATGVRSQVTAMAPVAVVSVEEAAAQDGATIARVRLGLTAPAQPRVRSVRNTIRVEFEPTPADESVHVLGTAPPVAPAADGRASVLSAVSADMVEGRLRVTLTGNGRVEPRTIEIAKDQPPRLFVDLPGVRASAPAVTPVGRMDVQRIRIATNSVSPLVTRVVVDLTKRLDYQVERAGEQGRDVAIVFGSTTKGSTAAASPAAVAAPPAVVPAPALDPAPAPVVAVGVPPSVGPVDETVPTPPTVPMPPTAKAQAPEAPAKPAKKLSPKTAEGGSAEKAGQAGEAGKGVPQGSTGAAQPLLAGAERSASLQQTANAQKFTGHPVSLDFQGVDLRAVLRTFAEITGLNIVIDPAVQGTVDVSLRDVPWDQALDIILRANQLGYTVEGNIVRIAPLRVLSDEEAQRRKLADERALSGELKVLTKTLSYSRASQVAPLIVKTALSSRGTVQVDDRTNTLIITDLAARLDTATSLLNSLDRPEPQVEIEARIVQTTREFARSIGVQWGFSGFMTPELGNTSNLSFPNQGSVTGRTGGVGSDGRTETRSAVNLSAVNPTSGVGLALGAVNGAFNIDVALTAAERQGKARVLSTPRVSTQNNVEAEVTQGTQIPIQTVANNTVTVTFKDAALTLKVKPQITAAQTVIMKITLENASADFSRAVNGIPPIDTQRANTEVLVSDGFTTVIGGIFVSRESTVNDRTPGLYRIPLLGWLFKRDSIADSSTELLIFITPRIIKS